jgi:hypothetical protein
MVEIPDRRGLEPFAFVVGSRSGLPLVVQPQRACDRVGDLIRRRPAVFVIPARVVADDGTGLGAGDVLIHADDELKSRLPMGGFLGASVDSR